MLYKRHTYKERHTNISFVSISFNKRRYSNSEVNILLITLKEKKMVNDINQLSTYLNIKPIDVASDIEYVRNASNTKFCIAEISFWDVSLDIEIFTGLVCPDEEFSLSRRMQERGISRSDIVNSITLDELDKKLKYQLPIWNLILYHKKNEIRNYHNLHKYSFRTYCAMERYADRFGPYDYQYGDHNYLKLEDAATRCGFELEENEYFHQARTDARATAHIWRWLNSNDLPSPCPSDLILREDVMKLLNKSDSESKDLISQEINVPF